MGGIEAKQIQQYLSALFPPDDELEQISQNIRKHGMPEISVHPMFGRLLTILVTISGARHILEIGALGGYSGLCLARGLKNNGGQGKIISLELDPKFAAVARKHLQDAGYSSLAEIRIGDALTSLQQLAKEGTVFDLVFIDADKPNYPHYLDWAMKLLRPGGLIVGDNCLLGGRSAEADYHSPAADAMRAFNERIASDPRLEGVILPAYDGLAVARFKG